MSNNILHYRGTGMLRQTDQRVLLAADSVRLAADSVRFCSLIGDNMCGTFCAHHLVPGVVMMLQILSERGHIEKDNQSFRYL